MFGASFKRRRGSARNTAGLAAAAVLAVGMLAACGGSDSGSAPSAAPPAAVAPTITAQPAALTVTEGDGAGALETQRFAIGADTAGNAYGTVESGEFTSNADLRLRKLRYP